jgi:hypothetical protein
VFALWTMDSVQLAIAGSRLVGASIASVDILIEYSSCCSSVPGTIAVHHVRKWAHRISAEHTPHQRVSAAPSRYGPYGAQPSQQQPEQPQWDQQRWSSYTALYGVTRTSAGKRGTRVACKSCGKWPMRRGGLLTAQARGRSTFPSWKEVSLIEAGRVCGCSDGRTVCGRP